MAQFLPDHINKGIFFKECKSGTWLLELLAIVPFSSSTSWKHFRRVMLTATRLRNDEDNIRIASTVLDNRPWVKKGGASVIGARFVDYHVSVLSFSIEFTLRKRISRCVYFTPKMAIMDALKCVC